MKLSNEDGYKCDNKRIMVTRIGKNVTFLLKAKKENKV